MEHTQDFMAPLSWEAKCLGWVPLQARCCGECELGVPKGLGVLPGRGGGCQLSRTAHLCLPIQGSPQTGHRPKGEQDPARSGVNGAGGSLRLCPLLPLPCS